MYSRQTEVYLQTSLMFYLNQAFVTYWSPIQSPIFKDVKTLVLRVKSKAKSRRCDQTSVSPCDVTLGNTRRCSKCECVLNFLQGLCVMHMRTGAAVTKNHCAASFKCGDQVTRTFRVYLGLHRRFVTFSRIRKLRRPKISLTCWFTGKFRFIFFTCKDRNKQIRLNITCFYLKNSPFISKTGVREGI